MPVTVKEVRAVNVKNKVSDVITDGVTVEE
jgi:hypothetical protein